MECFGSRGLAVQDRVNKSQQASSSSTVSTLPPTPWPSVRNSHPRAQSIQLDPCSQADQHSRRVQERPAKPSPQEPGAEPLSRILRDMGSGLWAYECNQRQCIIAAEEEDQSRSLTEMAV